MPLSQTACFNHEAHWAVAGLPAEALTCAQVYLFIKLATVQLPAQKGFGDRAVTATADDLGHPELDGLDAAQRQALYEAVVQEMIRVCNAGLVTCHG